VLTTVALQLLHVRGVETPKNGPMQVSLSSDGEMVEISKAPKESGSPVGSSKLSGGEATNAHMRSELKPNEKRKAVATVEAVTTMAVLDHEQPCDPRAASLILPETRQQTKISKPGPHSASTIPDHVMDGDNPCQKLNKQLTPAVMHRHTVKTDPVTNEKVQVPDEEVAKDKEQVYGVDEGSAKDRGYSYLYMFFSVFFCCAFSALVGICATRYSQERKVKAIRKERLDKERQAEFEGAAAHAAAVSSGAPPPQFQAPARPSGAVDAP